MDTTACTLPNEAYKIYHAAQVLAKKADIFAYTQLSHALQIMLFPLSLNFPKLDVDTVEVRASGDAGFANNSGLSSQIGFFSFLRLDIVDAMVKCALLN